MKASVYVRVGSALLLVFALAAGTVTAEPHGAGPRGGPGHFDAHFGHNHFYPERGVYVGALPAEHVVVNHLNERFYYAGGVWYRPWGPRFVVVAPPVGVFVPVLPGFYTTVWIGGFPYYYANDVYYAWRPDQNAYEVVDPQGAESATTQAPVSQSSGTDVFVYPKNGQSEEQQAQDKYECHRWAFNQSGFDPTQSGGGVPADQNGAKREQYQRALGACLEGRGYSVK